MDVRIQDQHHQGADVLTTDTGSRALAERFTQARMVAQRIADLQVFARDGTPPEAAAVLALSVVELCGLVEVLAARVEASERITLPDDRDHD